VKKQIWLTEQDRELLDEALSFLISRLHHEEKINHIAAPYVMAGRFTEKRVAEMRARLGMPVEATKMDWREEARAHIAAGDHIKAIRHCRNKTGLGLKEAKDAIDDMAAGIPA
jgi:ribosomal protein L7/L12